jgi:Zn finger protein HypA/HybF involved in hydrogenase expression
MSMAEDEFTLGLFLHGTVIYDNLDLDNSRTTLYCIVCKKTIAKEQYIEFCQCPSCRMNSVISLQGRSTFNKLKIEVLREKIILDVLRGFDFEEYED